MKFVPMLAAAAVAFVFFPTVRGPAPAADYKHYECSGMSDCERAEFSTGCQAHDAYTTSSEEAVRLNVRSCEDALNNGGAACGSGGWCCKRGSIACHESSN